MNDRLWTIADVAAYFVVSETQAASIVAQKGFPVPAVLPSRGTGERKLRRWFPGEVKSWAGSLVKAA